MFLTKSQTRNFENNNNMAKLISIIKLLLDMGAIAITMLAAALELYHQYCRNTQNNRQGESMA